MKKAYIYLTGFFVLISIFTTIYYISFQSAIGKTNHTKLVKEDSSTGDTTAKPIENATKEEAGKPVQANQTNVVTPSTKYVLETYDVVNQSLESDSLNTPEFLIGLTREEVTKYLKKYMEEVPFEEYEKGLLSYELVSFSTNKVVLRKNYNSNKVSYLYYLAVEDGMITVFYSDKTTVFDYTDIEVSKLAVQDQERLKYGVYIKDLQELYGILESYSS